MTVTSFINGVLEQTAEETLCGAVRERELSDRDSRALLRMLSAPKVPNRTLARAASGYRERFGGR